MKWLKSKHWVTEPTTVAPKATAMATGTVVPVALKQGVKRCTFCYTEVPVNAKECPKCGGSRFITADKSDPLRKIHQFFTVAPFYTKASNPVIMNEELDSIPIMWKVYKARTQPNAPPIFLLDRDGYVTPSKPQAALHVVDWADLGKILAEIPKKYLEEIEKTLREEWGLEPSDEGSKSGEGGDGAKIIHNIVDMHMQTPVFFESVPRLKDISILEQTDWQGYVEKLVCPKDGKDAYLVKVHRSKLLKPLAMKYAPHSIEVTNSGTGKTTFYDIVGIRIDKATPKSALGYAKSPSEVHTGTVHQTELPTAFDQLESQTSRDLARYMFNIMEKGEATVDAGAFRFRVETKSSFAYLGNPVAKDPKTAEAFRALLDHLTNNSALGRRFGIILFRTDLKPIEGSDKMTLTEEEKWENRVALFRAVEEYASRKLRRLIKHPKVTEWLHKPIPGYRDAVLNAISELQDHKIALFFEAHVEAEHRVRGAALHAAVALLLDKIALGNFAIEDVLKEAEDLLTDYVDINIQSIVSIARNWEKMRADQAKTIFDNLSDYMKEIVSAVLRYKQAKPDAVRIPLATIPYEPENKKVYPYFSKCIDLLKRRKRLDTLNEKLRNYFGFQIERENGSLSILYFEKPKPPENLPLVGNFVGSSISSFRSETHTP